MPTENAAESGYQDALRDIAIHYASGGVAEALEFAANAAKSEVVTRILVNAAAESAVSVQPPF